MSLIKDFDKLLAGKPDKFITILLVGLSLFGIVVALYGSPAFKLFLAAYFLFP